MEEQKQNNRVTNKTHLLPLSCSLWTWGDPSLIGRDGDCYKPGFIIDLSFVFVLIINSFCFNKNVV